MDMHCQLSVYITCHHDTGRGQETRENRPGDSLDKIAGSIQIWPETHGPLILLSVCESEIC